LNRVVLPPSSFSTIQGSTKHVESSLDLCLDEGSNPSSSTNN